MDFKFNEEAPIYLQILVYIKTQIISKKYLPRQKLPSVRELSFEFQVNPNTVQKALYELENLGLILTERTSGKFVTDNETLIDSIRNQTIDSIVDEFYQSMKNIGIVEEHVLQIISNKRSKK